MTDRDNTPWIPIRAAEGLVAPKAGGRDLERVDVTLGDLRSARAALAAIFEATP